MRGFQVAALPCLGVGQLRVHSPAAAGGGRRGGQLPRLVVVGRVVLRVLPQVVAAAGAAVGAGVAWRQRRAGPATAARRGRGGRRQQRLRHLKGRKRGTRLVRTLSEGVE